MAARILVIGNRNYSSWSLRPWLFMKQNAIAFEEVCIPLYQAGSKERLLKYSPSGKVPVLVEGEIRIWDSLAILEYLAETHPGIRGWPADTIARATARSACAEMHSGFPALRENLSMNVRKVFAPRTWPAEVGAGRVALHRLLGASRTGGARLLRRNARLAVDAGMARGRSGRGRDAAAVRDGALKGRSR